jgi:membrane protein DedA with SNARE-associated domain
VLADFIDSLAKALQNLLDVAGIPGIVLIAFFENMFPPTPSEFLYPLAGKYAADGEMSLIAIIVAGVLGSLIGSLLYYALGYFLGADRTRSIIERYGAFRLIRWRVEIVTPADYDLALTWFERRGGWVIFIARIMPLVHSVVSIPAGVTRMNLLAFLLITTLGVVAWIAPLSIFGYWLGNNWEQVLNALNVYQNVWYVLMALFILWLAFRRWNRHRNQGDTA